MAKKGKSKKAGGPVPPTPANAPREQSKKVFQVVLDWEEYFGPGDLPQWQRLMTDLGFSEQFASKSQCRKTLENVWVNIPDFLRDNKAGRLTRHFDDEAQLSEYTRKNNKIYPKAKIPQGSPLRKLLAHVFSPRGRRRN
ncbi:hypothetical protein F4819DRAFT_504819 [Hypoxylon fuscum]|nr:hypothetical protein F4819DRAFT_504819 [Hypoxylon fuscum]